MKIVCFAHNGIERWGVYEEQTQKITPLDSIWPNHVEGLKAGVEELTEKVKQQKKSVIDSGEVSWSVPVMPTNKIFCVGLNYGRHVLEVGRELPTYPSLFLRHIDSFVGHEQAIIKPSVSDQFDYEGELVIVIGKRARHISEESAWDYIAGYTCMAENSIRDFQKHAAQVTAGKNFDHSGAIGPWITTANAVSAPDQFSLRTYLNEQLVQDGNTADFIFTIPSLIAYVSSFTELKPGDLIATGTPEGVGMKRQPPLYMQVGDRLKVEIEQVGALVMTVVNENTKQD